MTQTLNSNLQKLLILHEGKKNKPYTDTVGKLTIGCGRNLTDRGISDSEMSFMLSNDIDDVNRVFRNNFPRWNLSEPRQLVILDMLFNLGINRFLGFRKMMDAITAGDYNRAADEMLFSSWHTQVGARAERLAEMMRTGNLPKELM
jgi:lysozyme